ncbi:MAG: aminomethyl-transferring glycine dehydrogenase subunit GcvPA [Candidatus Thermoplasmatota archaeon]|nr:aminomethyl-transferring glycine dehydrogenase subunit GcvPA [Candidatus Thermoplasmatota archaeon]
MTFTDEMFKFLNIKGYDDLFSDIPESVKKPLKGIGRGKSEMEITLESEAVGSLNRWDFTILLGLGAYERYIPAAVNNVIMRNEFITAYTPYQAEISQGMLQALFEYQSLICDLTGMEVTNSSMYDGPSSLAEAVRMAYRINGKRDVLIPENIYRNHLEVLRTYTTGVPVNLIFYGVANDGTINIEKLKEMITEDTCAIVTYNPSTFGIIDHGVNAIREIKGDALHIAYYDPVSLALISSPGEYDADISVSEGQQLGIPLNFGGPYLGLFSFKEKYVRKSPGRLIGETVDVNGKRAYVMTLQTREQHIRRDKAMSNICTNQALMALASSVYLSVLGNTGLEYVATKTMENSRKLASVIDSVHGFRTRKTSSMYFSDIIVDVDASPEALFSYLQKNGILGGYPAASALAGPSSGIGRSVFFAATEITRNDTLEKLKKVMEVF